MDYIEKTVSQKYVFKGNILKVRFDEAELPDGKPCTREFIEHGGGACVLYVENNKILLVRQFRYPYAESIYEIPAGKLDKGENPKHTALRELEEEGGVTATDAELLYVMYPSPGYTNEKIYIYRVHEGKRTDAHLDDGEFLDAEFVPEERVWEMLQKREICDGKTIIALQAYFLSKK